ncbi:hypothetical protein [Ilyobacter polytropus]|uniref:Uncharacterized protein n=1 Tax=Ilyobacter polytropus (strain ATCC 51220 / DSM 2926 / LMG 16218 / CuHBu1) TaxID=572544 RepID=E3H843_ILYPC|nr:hypothetical protein [Ilyobacter polytropus]ADO83274.1 hypothetical protein Ilyop_1494 [Ilyobacter polytropus DSM 2926]
MEILKLSLYLTIMLGMAFYFRKKVLSKPERETAKVKITKGIIK